MGEMAEKKEEGKNIIDKDDADKSDIERNVKSDIERNVIDRDIAGSGADRSGAERDSAINGDIDRSGIESYGIRRVDLHIHSTISDGTDTPEEIIGKIIEAGIDLFSLTDHDSIKGAEIVRELLDGMGGHPIADKQSGEDGQLESDRQPVADKQPAVHGQSVAGGQAVAEGQPRACRSSKPPIFVGGVELSCRDDDGKYHILGYGYDPSDSQIRTLVDKVHGFRMQKAKDRLDYLDLKYGIRFHDEDADAYLSMDNPGKPQLGNLITHYGYAPDRKTAIEQFINKMGIRSQFVHPEEAIVTILSSGGIPILAHPSLGSGSEYITGDDMEHRLCHLMDMGLMGVEAYYSRFTPHLQSEMLYFAKKYGLYVTAGSDYHGLNKPVKLGDNHLEDAGTGAPGLMAFISRILSS